MHTHTTCEEKADLTTSSGLYICDQNRAVWRVPALQAHRDAAAHRWIFGTGPAEPMHCRPVSVGLLLPPPATTVPVRSLSAPGCTCRGLSRLAGIAKKLSWLPKARQQQMNAMRCGHSALMHLEAAGSAMKGRLRCGDTARPAECGEAGPLLAPLKELEGAARGSAAVNRKPARPSRIIPLGASSSTPCVCGCTFHQDFVSRHPRA